jgi:hypothetical protein
MKNFYAKTSAGKLGFLGEVQTSASFPLLVSRRCFLHSSILTTALAVSRGINKQN